MTTEIDTIHATTYAQTTHSPLVAFSRRTATMIPHGLAAHPNPSRITLVRSLLTWSALAPRPGEPTPRRSDPCQV